MTSRTSAVVSFEFFAITGKTYSIEESADLTTWTLIPMSVVSGGTATNYYRATAVGILPAYVAAKPGTSRFYRLTVR